MDNDNDVSQESPRYVDETGEADKNLRPNLEETEQRGTNKKPLDLKSGKEENKKQPNKK